MSHWICNMPSISAWLNGYYCEGEEAAFYSIWAESPWGGLLAELTDWRRGIAIHCSYANSDPLLREADTFNLPELSSTLISTWVSKNMFDLDISAGLSSQWDQATSSHQSPVLVFTVKVDPPRVFRCRPLRSQSSKRVGSSPHDKSLFDLNFSPSSRGSGDNVDSGVPPAGSAESWEITLPLSSP